MTVQDLTEILSQFPPAALVVLAYTEWNHDDCDSSLTMSIDIGTITMRHGGVVMSTVSADVERRRAAELEQRTTDV